MKRLFCMCLAVLLLAMAGCRKSGGEIMESTEGVAQTLSYQAQYVRTNGGEDGTAYPQVRIVKSEGELRNYYEDNKDIFDLKQKENIYADTSVGFLDACGRYTEHFFQTQALVLVVLEEGSGSVRHSVEGVVQNPNGEIKISILRKVPEAGTSDMAQWHILLELDKKVITENVCVYLDGILAWDEGVVPLPKAAPAFTKPPAGMLRTPVGDMPLAMGGYSWTAQNPDGTETSTIADQTARPLPKECFTPVAIPAHHAESIYVQAPDSGEYMPINTRGYFVKLGWEVQPDSVTFTCWQDAMWQKGETPETKVFSQENSGFYARDGGYVYEMVATWEDKGEGWYGTANYYIYILGGTDHTHQTAPDPQTVADPVTGYCGNTWTRLYIGDKKYEFMYGHSVTLTDILVNLAYDPMKVCRCRPEYTVDTEFATDYGINLSKGYARCEKGQADLTKEQVDTIREIIRWAETTNCQYPIPTE